MNGFLAVGAVLSAVGSFRLWLHVRAVDRAAVSRAAEVVAEVRGLVDEIPGPSAGARERIAARAGVVLPPKPAPFVRQHMAAWFEVPWPEIAEVSPRENALFAALVAGFGPAASWPPLNEESS